MKKLSMLGVLAVCLFAALPASASPMSLWVNLYPHLTAVNTNFGWVYAGPLDAYYGQSVNDIDNLPDGEHVGAVYCIDIHHDIVQNPFEFYAVDKVNTDVGFHDQGDRTGDLQQVAWLVNNFSKTASTPYEWASMQLAIWKICYPTFQYVSGLTDTNKMNFYLTQSLNKQASSVRWFDYQGSSPGGQDMIRAVPEPASLFLLGSGLVGMALVLRKRR